MSSITRRQAVTRILSASALAVPFERAEVFGLVLPGEEIAPSERQQMAGVADAFMRKFDVPGLSVAIAREGRIVYESAFGEANRQAGQRLSVANLFRIASLTKPITATAIFTLIERGKLRQHDRVFGPGGVLGTKFGKGILLLWLLSNR